MDETDCSPTHSAIIERWPRGPSADDLEAYPFVVYLLHAPVPVGRVRHYVGITRSDRLAKRLHEHCQQRGSALTAAMARLNSALMLAELWPAAGFEDERRIKRQGRYGARCRVCATGRTTAALAIMPCPSKDHYRALLRSVTFSREA